MQDQHRQYVMTRKLKCTLQLHLKAKQEIERKVIVDSI